MTKNNQHEDVSPEQWTQSLRVRGDGLGQHFTKTKPEHNQSGEDPDLVLAYQSAILSPGEAIHVRGEQRGVLGLL